MGEGGSVHGELHQHYDEKRDLLQFHHDGALYKDKPLITALFSYAEVVEAFATQDPNAYKQEAVETFLMPLDRYPVAYPIGEAYPMSDQVLALRIRVQTAQQFGMITLPTSNGLIITSGVPVKSVVGALDHKGRVLEALSLPTMQWEVADSPREQYPCNRGLCYLPSLEVFHAYRVPTESTDGAPILMNLPAYEPSKNRNLRAPRAIDATGIHPEMMYCEFKGCTIMVYGKMLKPPIGSSRFPGWDTMARPARLDITMNPPGKGDGKGRSATPQPKGKGDGKNRSATPKPKGKGKGKGKKSDRVSSPIHSHGKTRHPDQIQINPIRHQRPGRIRTMRIFQLCRMRVQLITMWQHMCREHLKSLLSESHGSPLWVS